MTLTKKLAAGALAGILALSVTACSTSSAAINSLVNQSSAYTVTEATATAGVINQAIETYKSYVGDLTDTDDLIDDLEDDGYSAGDLYYQRVLSRAKQKNLDAKSKYDSAIASLNADGLSEVHTITSADIGADLNDEQAVADYVAGQLTGDAEIYVSDIISVPQLDDAEGSYTGAVTSLRYIYISYTK